jgi:hypothetical protein
VQVKIKAEAGDKIKLKLLRKTFYIDGNKKKYDLKDADMAKGETILIKNGFE